MATLRRTCATVPQPSELPFGVVRPVGRGIATLGGPHSARERRGFGVSVPIFTMGNGIRSPTLKCFRFIYDNLTTFPFGKRTLESSIRGLFGDVHCVSKKVLPLNSL